MQATMGGSGGAITEIPMGSTSEEIKYEDACVQICVPQVTSSTASAFGRIVEDIFGFYTKPPKPEPQVELEPEVFDWEPDEGEGAEEVAPPSLMSSSRFEMEECEEEAPPTPRPVEDVIKRYTLTNWNGVSVQIINYGATVVSIRVPDKCGIEEDVVLGFDNLEGYISKENQYFGGMIGRVAQIIPDGECKVHRKEIFLSNNLGEHHFHGGLDGFDKVVWESYIQNGKVIMTYISKDREEGYPGNVLVQLVFKLTSSNQFVIEISATPSKPTPIAITPQIYFNLAGHGTGPEGLKEHCIMVNADRFVLVDAETNIPTGKLEDVGGTYYDLRVPRPFEKILNNVPGGGYDHTFCLTKGGAKRATTFSARLVHPPTGRYLEVYTDNPGLHIYTADKLPNPDRPLDLLSPSVLGLNVFRVAELDEFDGEYSEELERRWPEGDWPRPASAPEEEHVFPTYSQTMVGRDGEALGPEDGGEGEDDYPQHLLSEGESIVEEQWEDVWVPPKEIDGKMGCTYRNHGAVCLMPGEYPNAVNNKRFPSPVVYPGEMYKRTLMYSFGIVKQKKQRKLSTIVEEIREKDIVQD